ncbi:radical SAM protein [bacterium]|jgi:radical SAM superfamily enzyme YgiQ (UPF0313 family)|nr:radical SAM protein [bacterium]
MKIYLADLTHTGMGINSDAFPLGIGLIASHAIQTYGDNVDITLYKLPEDLLSALKQNMPDVIGFSSYNWNFKLSSEIARYVKRLNPKIIVIFGGPNFPLIKGDRKLFLQDNKFIDFYIKFDGEYAFTRLLKELDRVKFDIVALKEEFIELYNVCYVVENDYIEGDNERIKDLNLIRSPYVLGLMDKFFNLDIMPLIETTRGCPFSCTFCTDGNVVRSKVYHKSEKYIKEELEYIAAKVKSCLGLISADLNFGSYVHDIETAKIIRDVYKEHEWPQRMIVSSGKTRPERMVETSDIINNSGQDNLDIIQMGSSLQSLSALTLKKIKRKNLPKDKLMEMHKLNNNSQNFTELIIPLPGETLESFYSGLSEVVDDIEFDSIAIHNLTLLEGSNLAIKESKYEHKIDTRFRVFVGCVGRYNIGGSYKLIAEIEETAISTNTISYSDYIEIRTITLLVKIFIDGEVYKPIFGQLAMQGISKVSLLREILTNTIKDFPEFEIIINYYIQSVESKFFLNEKELERAIKENNLKDLVSGNLVQNELLTSRALAYKDHFDDCDKVFKKAALSLLRSKDKDCDELIDYIDDAILFLKNRRYNFGCTDDDVGKFNYDFIYAERFGFNISLKDFKKQTEIFFKYSQRDIKLFKDYKKLYGGDNATLFETGKFIQKVNWTRTQRNISYA